MNKSIKIVLITLSVLILLVISLFLFLWASQDKIKQYAVAELNEQLVVPVSVAGIELDFFEQFPLVSLSFQKVIIPDPIRKNQQLFKADQLYISFNINDILQDKYKIKRIKVDSGFCSIYSDLNHQVNYQIFKQQDTSNQGNFRLELKSVTFHQFRFIYQEEVNPRLYDVFVQDVELSGDFKATESVIKTEGLGKIHLIKNGSMVLFQEMNLSFQLALQMNSVKGFYHFDQGSIRLGKLTLNANGDITKMQKGYQLGIQFDAGKLSIIELLQLLPQQYTEKVKQYSSEGAVIFKGSINGIASESLQPSILIEFGITNGKLIGPNKLSLEHIQCNGSYSNGKDHTLASSYILFPTFSCELGNGKVGGSLNMRNFLDPSLSMHLQGDLALNDIVQFFPNSFIKDAKGSLDFDLQLNGKWNELGTSKGWIMNDNKGTIHCKASKISLLQAPYQLNNVSANLMLDQKNLNVDFFTVQVNQSDLSLTGNFVNFMPYLFQKNQTLSAQLFVESKNLNWVDFKTKAGPNANVDSLSGFQLPTDIELTSRLNVDNLTYNLIKANKFSGTLFWKDKKMALTNCQFDAFNGAIKLNGTIENTPDYKFIVAGDVDCKKVDLSQLLYQNANFGQSEITDKELKGTLTSSFSILGVWDRQLNCDLDKLYALGNVHIANGQIIDYRSLDALSKYLSIEELHNLRFEDITNTLEIKHKTINIPAMEVKSNAINLTISGTHTFENYVDYHLKLKLSDLLAKKFKLKSSEYELEQLEQERFLFLSMKGPIDNIKFSYDKQEARTKVKQDLKLEKETVKELWRKELGIEKKDKVKEKTNDSEELEFEAE